MTTKMIFACSCGALFDIVNATGMENHIDVHPSHVVTEAVTHISTTPTTLTTVQDALIVQIRTKRDDDRLERDVLAEYPVASAKMWSCGRQSQSDWSALVSMESRSLVMYPFRAYTFDERDHYDIVDAVDLTAIVAMVSTAVLTERALAQSYVDAVLAAPDESDAEDAAQPYFDL